MSVLHVHQNQFDQLKNESKPVLLDFFAEWCGPCRMVGPIVEEIARENPDVVVAKVNVDEEPELAAAFGVVSIPTLVVLRNGEETRRVIGARPKAQILAMLDA